MASLHPWICASLMAFCLASCVAAAGRRRELTTRSWDSLGFHENIARSPTEDQIIIAVVDTGIWPESPSFSDQGLGPPPAKWKGVCDPGFKCNNKIIGARGYYDYDEIPAEERTPRDTDGHGTHVAATVAGVLVRNVSMQGVGLGTARGAVPRARLAIYKVCWYNMCLFRAQGVIDAIKDGADIISMSSGGGVGAYLYGLDEMSFASFEAMKAGLFFAASAGNNRSMETFTVGNTFPWMTTVGNSVGSGTNYVTYVNSGDGKRFEGALMNILENGKTLYPLVLNEEVTNATDPALAHYCIPENMKPESVKGKIILCQALQTWPANSTMLDHLGCAGLLVNGSIALYRQKRQSLSLPVGGVTPVIVLSGEDFKYLTEYYKSSNSTGKPATASIEKTISTPDTAPQSALSSARGPSLEDLSIIKPDVSAPGVNLITAFPGNPGYKAMSGTSMATPFLSGVAAYIKSFHPTWSAAAIKSALMTTASPMVDPYNNQGELAYGSGQISPVLANDPGLIYDAGELDYVKHLCQLSSLSNQFLFNVTQNSTYDCAKLQIEKGWTLNYPSFAIPAVPDQPFVSVFRRRVTNVANSSIANYKAIVSAPKELKVTIEPSVLAFTEVGQALSYTLTVEGQLPKSSSASTAVLSASVVWTDGGHQVRSPIAVFEKPADMKVEFTRVFGIPYPG